MVRLFWASTEILFLPSDNKEYFKQINVDMNTVQVGLIHMVLNNTDNTFYHLCTRLFLRIIFFKMTNLYAEMLVCVGDWIYQLKVALPLNWQCGSCENNGMI